jgi:hypothetical protein
MEPAKSRSRMMPNVVPSAVRMAAVQNTSPASAGR